MLGDKLGRKKIYLITLLLMIFATIAQALSASVVKGAPSLRLLPARDVPSQRRTMHVVVVPSVNEIQTQVWRLI